MSDHLPTIRAFFAQHIAGTDLADDTDVFTTGHVNSLFAVQLVMWVEQTFDIAVQGGDVDIKHFSSIGDVDRFVTGKLGAPAA